ncbi:hypothetical protein VCRA2126O85_230047 [Vibrio crassostreae]|nr:hypothetical protein VCRA2126O85_230047 [Vibrio crassostreae]CAK2775208.1 hypothetical protein VCRA2126O86_240047 [Vibrio crassostreae]CAK3254079.1 hypothetical protein VCRA2128O102_210048 [Vibrio crassostreae]CAK3369792.1 hypothetical protein VCRA2126O87_240042 [Vibrio crassostreae]CAK3373640.1 hypothetical protein VCRA2126O88_250047 [Vibrio crassostreae]
MDVKVPVHFLYYPALHLMPFSGLVILIDLTSAPIDGVMTQDDDLVLSPKKHGIRR